MQKNRQQSYCSAVENRNAICAQPCDNASMTWHKGNEVFRCEFYDNAINAFDNLNDLWPFARILKSKGRAKQDSRMAAKAPEEVSRPAIR